MKKKVTILLITFIVLFSLLLSPPIFPVKGEIPTSITYSGSLTLTTTVTLTQDFGSGASVKETRRSTSTIPFNINLVGGFLMEFFDRLE